MTLRRLETHAELLEATAGDPFVRYDLPHDLADHGYALGRAVAVPQQDPVRRLGLLVMGPPADVGSLVLAMAEEGLHPRSLTHVTVTRGSLDAVDRHLPVSEEGSEWEWMHTTTTPELLVAEDELVPLGAEQLGEIKSLLAEANPRTDARPFATSDQVWVGVRNSEGRLVACGCRIANLAGRPLLEGITTLPAARGRGLGLAVTAYLTREAVETHGVCTLGMYSDNEVARRVYHGLGYSGEHLWSTYRLRR